MWTSYARDADYCWLAVRTDPDAHRHRGISILVVPMDTPGITVNQLNLLATTTSPPSTSTTCGSRPTNLVGEENDGWRLITNQLNHERVTLCSPGMVDQTLHEVIAWARATHAARRHSGHRPGVGAAQPGQGVRRLRVPAAANWKVAVDGDSGQLPVADASTIKVFGTEHYLDVLPPADGGGRRARPTCSEDSPGAVLAGRLESIYRSLLILTFGGGVNELQRDLIAAFGLGCPWPSG